MATDNNSLASVLTKTITDILDQTDKRFVDQKASQENQAKLSDELKTRLLNLETKLTNLETKCQELNNENINLKAQLKQSKEKENETAKEIVQVKSDLEKQQNRIGGYEGWIDLISTIGAQINCLNTSRDSFEERFREIHDNQADLIKQVRRQQQQLTAALTTSTISPSTSSSNYRAPIKSPSASSYLNNGYMSHSSLPSRIKPPTYQKSKSSFVSIDTDEHMSELDDQFANLNRGVEALNDLQRSFEKNSIYSDD